MCNEVPSSMKKENNFLEFMINIFLLMIITLGGMIPLYLWGDTIFAIFSLVIPSMGLAILSLRARGK